MKPAGEVGVRSPPDDEPDPPGLELLELLRFKKLNGLLLLLLLGDCCDCECVVLLRCSGECWPSKVGEYSWRAGGGSDARR